MGTVSKLLRLRNGRLPPSVNGLGNLDPSRSSPEGHNQIRVSTPASSRRIGQRSSIRPVSPLPECSVSPQGIALRMLSMARAAAHASGHRALAFVTVNGVSITLFPVCLVRGLALVARYSDPSNHAASVAVLDSHLVSPVVVLAPRPP